MAKGPIRALQVTPGGAINEVVLPCGPGGQLGAIREQIGCSIVEPVGLRPDLEMWCDEKGFVAAGPRLNLCAMGIAAPHGRLEEPYVGTAVFTGTAVGGGALDGLTERQVEDMRRECAHVIRLAVPAGVHGGRRSSPGPGGCVSDIGIGAG